MFLKGPLQFSKGPKRIIRLSLLMFSNTFLNTRTAMDKNKCNASLALTTNSSSALLIHLFLCELVAFEVDLPSALYK